MLTFLIPTAKEMKLPDSSFPAQFPPNSQPILDELAKLSEEQLTYAYKINTKASQKEAERIQAIYQKKAKTYPAYLLFNGLMYRNIKRNHLSAQEEHYLLKHVYITSSLYGIIPMDYPISEHRLDFQTKVKIRGKSLKNFWRPHYDAFIKKDMTIISLLSSEFEDVFSKDRKKLWISITFLEEKDGQLKGHSTISKKARGYFLSACMERNCQTLKELTKLDFKGFSYCQKLSSKEKYVYIKKEV
ncbi:peroxide stress protein YaaA [Streptococcus didelphis]|uniref:peroxide stress protein YaaA n=1 Tax=Streptococcus didelphis TaxID=102886 RepID=UPI000363B3BF|nr:peroxide stress protein YaaA [Streptococcus didelphis]